jgi:hypothetical protein
MVASDGVSLGRAPSACAQRPAPKTVLTISRAFHLAISLQIRH